MLTARQLRDGLDFYEIADAAYAAVLEACREKIVEDARLAAAFETASGRIYTEDPAVRGAMWDIRSMEQLFGCAMPEYIANLFILAGWMRQRDAMQRAGLDAEQCRIQRFRVRQQLLLADGRPLGVVPILWSSHFLLLEIVEVGRLQYERKPAVPGDPRLRVGIHIPPEGRLDPQAVADSLAAAGPYLERVFGRRPDVYGTTTWLISNQLRPLYRPGSNLASFSDLFDVTDGEDGIPDVKNYLFRAAPDAPPETLPEVTSLQRAVKEYLLGGGKVRLGCGVLKR